MEKELIIQATLSNRQFNMLMNREATLEIPYGTTLNHRKGSRVLMFDCENEECYKELLDGLDNSGIEWQEA